MNWGSDIQFSTFKSIRDMSLLLLLANGVALDLRREFMNTLPSTLMINIDDSIDKSAAFDKGRLIT
jgi:hypothetical protein